MPVLGRAHDRHRGVRARLPADLAADTEQDRHVMTKSSCERFCLPGPMRWLHAGGDFAQPSAIHQCAHRESLRSERPPKSLAKNI